MPGDGFLVRAAAATAIEVCDPSFREGDEPVVGVHGPCRAVFHVCGRAWAYAGGTLTAEAEGGQAESVERLCGGVIV